MLIELWPVTNTVCISTTLHFHISEYISIRICMLAYLQVILTLHFHISEYIYFYPYLHVYLPSDYNYPYSNSIEKCFKFLKKIFKKRSQFLFSKKMSLKCVGTNIVCNFLNSISKQLILVTP